MNTILENEIHGKTISRTGLHLHLKEVHWVSQMGVSSVPLVFRVEVLWLSHRSCSVYFVPVPPSAGPVEGAFSFSSL